MTNDDEWNALTLDRVSTLELHEVHFLSTDGREPDNTSWRNACSTGTRRGTSFLQRSTKAIESGWVEDLSTPGLVM